MEEVKEILKTILRPFKLEKEKNYSNLSVINGFDKYVINWVDKAINAVQNWVPANNSGGWLAVHSKRILNDLFIKLQKNFSNYSRVKIEGRAEIFKRGSKLIEKIENFLTNPQPPVPNFQNLFSPVQYLKGVGPERAKLLKRLGINTIFDLLTHYPFRYEDRSHLSLIGQIKDGEEKTIQAVVSKQKIERTRMGPLLKVILTDGTGEVIMTCFNQFYLKDVLSPGRTVIVTGKFNKKFRKVETSNFTYEVLTKDEEDLIHTNRIVPIYTITRNLNIRFLRTLIKKTLDEYLSGFSEILPLDIRNKHNLCEYSFAMKNIHFPENFDAQEKSRRRLVFDEFFLLQLVIALQKSKVKESRGIEYKIPSEFLEEFEYLLPFKLTNAQCRVINEILHDMAIPKPMNRLLQGDVGSGKTVVALASSYVAIKNGYQVAFMAPTEILAEQHFINLHNFLSTLGINSALLISGTGKKERKRILQDLASGEINLVIGTHALIEEDVNFKKLGFVIIDEQHKFGVIQRAILRGKGLNPDVLVMTATPIPRTLALTVYGDLDVSIIDELPPGRKRIETTSYTERKRGEVWELIREEIKRNRQVYVVYPLIEESEKIDLKAATEEFNRLRKVYPEFKVGLLHGRLPSKEKEDIMQKFKNKKIDILVSTTVIEVGIDIPNASIMLIEHPERFGLAQLHQLRGRIGRGKYESRCILLRGLRLSEEANQRINAFVNTNNGFEIAEVDLRLRGPGEFMGTRQHGMPDLKIADIIKDIKVLEIARHEAFNLVNLDSRLLRDEHAQLKEMIKFLYHGREKLIKVG